MYGHQIELGVLAGNGYNHAMKSKALRFLGLLLLTGLMHSHHSLSGVYDTSREIGVEGVVTQFQFINPHPFVVISVEANRSKLEWRLELDNRSELLEIGMSSNTFRPGDRVNANGNPGRSESQILYVHRLDRPADGLLYEQIGTTPRIQIPRK